MSPAIAAPAPRQPLVAFDPLHKAGFFLLCVYFFVTYSRVLDIVAPRLHIPMVLTICLYALTAFAGGIQSSLATLPGKLLVAITGWMIVGIPFSVWPGGVVDNLANSWLKVLPIFFTVVGLVLTTGECIRLIRWISWALLIMVLIALKQGDTVVGRLIIDNSRFSDPNDLSLMCLIGISLWCATLSLSRHKLVKVAAFGCVAVVFYAIVRTGSRGAFLGMIAMFGFMFLKSSMVDKLKMTLVVLVAVPLAMVSLPRATLLRWTMLFDSSVVEENQAELGNAAMSSEARWEMFLNGLALTARYPIFGVGLGNFTVADNDAAHEKGLARGSWHVGHNMYVQVSSECGIPAFLMYITVVGYTLRRVAFIRKQLAPTHPRRRELEVMALWLQIGLIGYCVSGFFLNVAFIDTLPLFTGIVVALQRAVRAEIAVGPAPVIQSATAMVLPRRSLSPVSPS